MLKRAVGGYPPCILPDTPAFGFHARNKIVLAVDEKSDKWRQVRIRLAAVLIIYPVDNFNPYFCCMSSVPHWQAAKVSAHNIDKSDTLEMGHDGCCVWL